MLRDSRIGSGIGAGAGYGWMSKKMSKAEARRADLAPMRAGARRQSRRSTQQGSSAWVVARGWREGVSGDCS